jgi:hypothetical protein
MAASSSVVVTKDELKADSFYSVLPLFSSET